MPLPIAARKLGGTGLKWGGVMAYDLDSRVDNAKLAEDQAFRRLHEMPDLEEWDEAFGAWLRAARRLRQEKLLSRVL